MDHWFTVFIVFFFNFCHLASSGRGTTSSSNTSVSTIETKCCMSVGVRRPTYVGNAINKERLRFRLPCVRVSSFKHVMCFGRFCFLLVPRGSWQQKTRTFRDFFLVMVTPPFDLSLQIVSKDCVFSLIHDKWFRQMLAGFCTTPKTNLGLQVCMRRKLRHFNPSLAEKRSSCCKKKVNRNKDLLF